MGRRCEVGVGVPEARGAINRAAQAILGVRAQGTNHGEIPGRFLLRERKTREEEGEADVWVRERSERSGARAGERVGRAGLSVRGRVLACGPGLVGGGERPLRGAGLRCCWAELGGLGRCRLGVKQGLG